MSASDGGLVCFVSRMLDKAANPFHIVLLNPLTKEYRVLSAPASLIKLQPQMVQLSMDRETKCHKVIVVGRKNQPTGTLMAKLYGSSSGRWSNTDSMPELVFGYHFRCTADGDHDQFSADPGGPCANACRVAALLQLGESVNPSLESCRGFTLVDDRLFVLHHETRTQRCRTMGRPDEEGRMLISRFSLSEYQGARTHLTGSD